MIRLLLFSILFAIIGKSHGEDVPGLINYLTQFGYLETPEEGGAPDSFSADDINSALKSAQKFGGIPVTGKLDNDTRKMLAAPRCGFPDTGSRVKRFGTSTKWQKRHITYGFMNYSPKLRPDQIENKLREGFEAWARPSGLRFSRVPSQIADIKIGFYKGEHGDGNPFDGPTGILAHAYFPGPDIGGDVHFDDDESWALNDSETGSTFGISILGTFTHEMGHALGLRHSYVPGAIMKPHYTAQTNLGTDDILGIKSLYGKKITNM